MDLHASVDVFKAVVWLFEPDLVFSNMNEGLETPHFSPGEYVFGKTVNTGKHKTSSTALTTAHSTVLDKSLDSHQFPH